MLNFCLKDTIFQKKKKRVNICLGAHLIFHLPPPNPTIFTQIEPQVFKFFISVFYTSILQGTTLSLPSILFVLQICEHCEGRNFMSNPPQAQRIIKSHLQFFNCQLMLNFCLKDTICQKRKNVSIFAWVLI